MRNVCSMSVHEQRMQHVCRNDYGVGMCTVGVRANANSTKVGEISVLITSKAQSFHWAGYGLKLNIPQEALPADLKECEIIRCAYLASLRTTPSSHACLTESPQ